MTTSIRTTYVFNHLVQATGQLVKFCAHSMPILRYLWVAGMSEIVERSQKMTQSGTEWYKISVFMR